MDDKSFDKMGSCVSPRQMVSSLPPVCDFLDRYDNGASLYPCQATILKIIFLDVEHLDELDRLIIRSWQESTENGGEIIVPLDLYDRMDWCRAHGYQNFNTVIFDAGRRSGKGFVGGKAVSYKLAQMISMGSPQRAFHIDASKEIYIDVLATNFSQAQGMLFNDAKDAILNNDWLAPYVYRASSEKIMLQTDADAERERKIKLMAKRNGRKNAINVPSATLVVEPSAVVSSAIRGRASIMQMYDEFAHGLDSTKSKSSSSELYEAATPSVMQFGGSGLIYVPSSPYSKAGKFYELYEQAFDVDANGKTLNPQMFCIKIPSWRMYDYWDYDPRKTAPIILSPDKSPEMRAKKSQNPEKFDVEWAANFAETENAYMSPQVIDAVFKPYPDAVSNINVTKEIGNLSVLYRAHADAGRSQDNFCFAMGHSEIMADGHKHAFIDVMKTWQPPDFPKDDRGIHSVDYTQVLDWLEHEFKQFAVSAFTMDQWNSALVLDQIRHDVVSGQLLNPAMGVSVDNHTSADNFKRWEAFKTACYQGWVHIPHQVEFIHHVGHECCLVEAEMKAMIIKNGNTVTWPTDGPGLHHGDMVDAVSTVVVSLLGDAANGVSDEAISNLTGAAMGGFGMADQGGLATNQRRQMGDDYMRQMGYY